MSTSPRTLGRFELLRELGRGNFGRVWLARERGAHGFQRRVALKILGDLGDVRRRSRLIREARICGRLNHPNIVAVHGVEEVGPAAFIIMEHVDGETLRSIWMELTRLHLRFPRSVILEVGISMAEGLHHAWSGRDEDGMPYRIVHRDLKPANVIVSMRGMAKVADFGLATFGGRRSAAGNRITGTPSYLAPEAWAGSCAASPSLDLWALGIILYELATGIRFYRGAETNAIPKMLVDRRPASEAADVEAVFPELAPLVERLLSRRRAVRPQSAIEVAEALRAIRAEVGAPGDLVQFLRLIRAGRIPAEERKGSLGILPTIPRGARDWLPLLELVSPAASSAPPLPETNADQFAFGRPVARDALDRVAAFADTGEHRMSGDG